MASASANTLTASSKVTPCLRSFDAALRGSHVKRTELMCYINPQAASVVVLRLSGRLGGDGPQPPHRGEFAGKAKMPSPNVLRSINRRHNPTQKTLEQLLKPFGLKLTVAPATRRRSSAA